MTGKEPKKAKHHFVPKCYLRNFQSGSKRINLFNVPRALAIQDAPLNAQCYRKKLYGQTNQVEDALMALEGESASVFRSVLANGRLPKRGSTDFVTLLTFVAVQILRTPGTAERFNSFVDKLSKQLFSHEAGVSEKDLEGLTVGFEDPIAATLHHLPLIIHSISDLSWQLVRSDSDAFITSDNPGFKYNMYCEGIRHRGVLGFMSAGLQIFLPLSPSFQIMLFDGKTYSLPLFDRINGISVATAADAVLFNSMQLVAADENIYFSNWVKAERIRELALEMNQHRGDPTVVREYGQDDDANNSLVHSFERMPNIRLNLSFLKIKWYLRHIPIAARAPAARRSAPFPRMPVPPQLKERAATFSRFIGER